MVSNVKNKMCQSLKYQNKQVKVTLEFPEQTDQKAEQEFTSLLKEIYLEKMKTDDMQECNFVLPCSASKDKEGDSNE